MMRRLHVLVSWALIAAGMIACARLAALIPSIDGLARVVLLFVGWAVGGWIGWGRFRFADLAADLWALRQSMDAIAGKRGPLRDIEGRQMRNRRRELSW